jgi:tetratricopeptide (TPR) repeat protein
MRNAKPGSRIMGLAALAMAVLASCARSPTPAFESALAQSRRYYQAGEYQKAIDVNATAMSKYPAEKAVREEYVRTLEGIHQKARAAMAAAEYASAERLYSILINNFDSYKGLGKSLGFSASGLSRDIRLCRTALEERRIAKYLEAGKYDEALGTLRALSPAELRDPGRATALAKTMEAIRRRGDRAAAAKDYVNAGKAYAALAGHYADASRLGLKLSFSEAALAAGLESCRAELTRRGLEHYRKGELSQAISAWQDLLQFDPANAEIRKAVETAREQQKELQKR